MSDANIKKLYWLKRERRGLVRLRAYNDETRELLFDEEYTTTSEAMQRIIALQDDKAELTTFADALEKHSFV